MSATSSPSAPPVPPSSGTTPTRSASDACLAGLPKGATIAAAWGVYGEFLGGAAHSEQLLVGGLLRIGPPTKASHARHPLYLPYAAALHPHARAHTEVLL